MNRHRWIATTAAMAALAACLLLPASASATAQHPDLIVIDGEERALIVNPLEVYLRAHPDKRPASEIRSTANWRGYESGKVTRRTSMDQAAFKRFRDAQFAAYKKTEAYRVELDETAAHATLGSSSEAFLYQFLVADHRGDLRLTDIAS